MVYFVGAGPGDPELITVKGKALLEMADTVIYAGSLVNPELLSYTKPSARIYDSARMTLEEVLEKIREEEERGGVSVRLHTGDPSLYGAIDEQMRELEKLGIPYTLVPGVSSFSAAAAALKLEYTPAAVSQTLILSRVEGRTLVPEREKLAALAGHHASMVLFLSAGMTAKVKEQLLLGGLSGDTPAAIVYKASWPDEQKVLCTVETLDLAAETHGIHKTALLLIGDFLKGGKEKSRLYASDFSTGYREGTDRSGISVCAFTDRGEETALALSRALCASYTRIRGNLGEWTEKHFRERRALLFVGAAGIAVRAIAPFVRSKTLDPAVLCMDEEGQFVLPILSGHLGGANELARKIASLTGASAVITTASDRRGIFSCDSWAKKQNLHLLNPEKIVDLQSALLRGETIWVACPFEIRGNVPKGLRLTRSGDDPKGERCGGFGMVIDIYQSACRDMALHLVPQIVTLGIGCRKGTEPEAIEKAFQSFLEETGIREESIFRIATIDLKKEEEGLLRFARRHHLPLAFFSASDLEAVPGSFEESAFVREVTGAGNVCERAAAAGSGGALIIRKHRYEGVTMAASCALPNLSWPDLGEGQEEERDSRD